VGSLLDPYFDDNQALAAPSSLTHSKLNRHIHQVS